MPVKAAPVQYVKICSLYGDGFYYIPGTDICLKVGGYVRGEYAYPPGNSLANFGFASPSSNRDRLDGQDFTMRTRAYAWFDSRQQTEYGTLRSYLQIGVNYDSPQNTATNFNANRAFIQFAGFTVGTAQSFYDFYSSPASSFWGPNASDTGDPGWKVFAYTAQYGNGFSATFSLEEPRQFSTATNIAGVINTNLGNLAIGSNSPDADRAKVRFPDIVQNWRVDQAWGSAQLMVAAHDASGGYYAANAGNLLGNVAPCTGAVAGFLGVGAGTVTGSEACGHPADKLGWALGGGARLNAQGGDYFQFQVNYTQGAVRYAACDGVFSNATGEVQLTTAWGINAAYDHLWTPQLRTSIYGSYLRVEYGNNANLAICNAQTTPNFAGTGFATPSAIAGTIAFTGLQVAQGACNNNFNWWQAGSRTQYNFTPWFYVGFDVIYQKLESASAGNTVTYTATTAKPTAFYQIQNQDNYGLRIRVHRDIVP
jgi:Porin subfamily